MMHNIYPFILVTILLAGIRSAAGDAFGIPGTTQTDSGYDTEMGEDPMCWSSVASATPEGGIAFPNGALVKDFALADKVQLLSSCPQGTWLEARAPPEFDDPDYHPRTLKWYNYTVTGRINLAHLDGTHIAADEGSKIAIAILACDTLTAGFCSPFVHEQANIRLAREKEAKIAAGIPIPPAGPKIAGNRHGDTHVHSPAVVLEIPALPPSAPGLELPAVSFDFDVQVPMIVNEPGSFFMVGTLQFFTGETPFEPVHRYDVANALKVTDRLVVYEEPPTILEVTKPVLIISYVAIGLASLILMGLIAGLLKYRNHQVLRISQVAFLVAFLVAALVAVVSSFMLQPHSDLWCNLSHPLVVTSLHLFYSITLARLWRINAIVSPLLKNRLQRTGRAQQGLFSRMWGCCFESNNQGGRREVSPVLSSVIVFVCCLPQVLLQISAWLLQPESKVIDFNESNSVGRCICSSGMDPGHAIRNYALYLLVLLVLVLLGMGHVARNLPSLLNESAEIYDTTSLSVLLSILGGGVIAVTNAPTTSPDVAYLIKVFLVLTITLNSALRITVPKLRMARSDQKIVVSKLVADHRQSMFSDYTSRTDSRMNAAYNINSTRSSLRLSTHDSKASAAGSLSKLENSSTTDETSRSQSETAPPATVAATTASSQDLWLKDVESQSADIPSAAKKGLSSRARKVNFTPETEEEPKTSHQFRKKKIVIRQGEAPNKKIVLRMVDLQHELDHVTKQVMCGLNVEPQDWQAVRKLTQQLNSILTTVDFDFEQEGEDEELGE